MFPKNNKTCRDCNLPVSINAIRCAKCQGKIRSLKMKSLGIKPPIAKKGRTSTGGWHHSIEARKKISEKKKGKNWNYKGGISSENKKIRMSLEYKLWREAIFKRDSFTCIWCYKKGGILNADHIKPFSEFPELRFAIDNGRTLCIDCHKKTETYGVHK